MEIINEKHTRDASRSKSGTRDQFVTILHSWIGTNLIELFFFLSFRLSVYKVEPDGRRVLSANLSNPGRPSFSVSGLAPGSHYLGEVAGYNVKGVGVPITIRWMIRLGICIRVHISLQNSARICPFQCALSVCTMMHALEFKGCKEQAEEGPVINCNCKYNVGLATGLGG